MIPKLIYTPIALLVLLVSIPVSSVFSQANSEKFVVVLDAGHGGNDPGNLGNGFKEKDIALKVVLAVGKALEKNKDIKVIYTRETDVFIELRERAAIANKADADLFVSIHCNSHNSSAHGTETFVLGLHANSKNFEVAKKENEVIFLEKDYEKHYDGFDPNSPQSLIGLTLMQEEYLDQSIELASYIEKNFTTNLKRNSRGVKQAGFWVLHNTYMPSVLIELGFLTYKKEGVFLNSWSGQQKMANSIENAILSYKKVLDQNMGEEVYANMIEDDELPNSGLPEIYNNVVFKVQIAASSKMLDPKPYNFKGLKHMSREKVDGLYKYYYGYTSDYNQIKQMHEQAKKKGYDTCFVVAFKDGKAVSLDEALKSSSK
ncbi:N-acetylmuramoyl-L-alanine amidase family protein [Mangrovimonas aestuarii]|uniref:N-acetylmuramoyl-L-alanine amidase family protein n=1 Tax=Mangrovimonas aestuarii TaxID=3018443 RepID=UPI002379F88C|nr:N-acetylmuramoyl-L-alanine amidase [Mangrovimonas aestuarii]